MNDKMQDKKCSKLLQLIKIRKHLNNMAKRKSFFDINTFLEDFKEDASRQAY